MTVSNFIKQATNPDTLYGGIREMLSKMDEQGKYPEDWTIKRLQREADAKYKELTKG